jgi:peptidylprolyl isomerase
MAHAMLDHHPSSTRRIVVTRVLAPFIALALLLSACSDSKDKKDDPITESASALDAITVSGKAGEAPKVDFETPFSIDRSTRHTITEGTGDKVVEGDTVTFNLLLVNGRDASEITNTYATTPATVVVNDALLAGVRKGLLGSRVGGRVLVAITADDGYGPQGGDPASGLQKDDTMILVADILDIRQPLAKADGTAVAPVAGLPTVTLDAKGRPTITVPKTDPPATLVSQPLITGKGDVVTSGQTITVHYTGVIWASGQEFDSSWDGTPSRFSIGTGNVIAGWDKSLVGVPVGSQLLLVIPPADGYGTSGEPRAGISGTDTLVFVVDILDATD